MRDKRWQMTPDFAKIVRTSSGEMVMVYWETDLDKGRLGYVVHRVGKVEEYLYDVPIQYFDRGSDVEWYMENLGEGEADKIMDEVRKTAEEWGKKADSKGGDKK
jgi:hypothetical protein